MLVEDEFLKVGPVLFDIQIQLNDIGKVERDEHELKFAGFEAEGVGSVSQVSRNTLVKEHRRALRAIVRFIVPVRTYSIVLC